MTNSSPLVVIERRASPQDLVGRLPEPKGQPLACLVSPRSSAVILGSRQSDATLDTAMLRSLGVGWVKRHSGGGAVFVAPGEQVWLDVYVPHDHPRHDRDVTRSGWWLGEVWREALRPLARGPHELVVHRGPMRTTAFSTAVCFSGYGPGEVLSGDKKVVGLSQRRSKDGAWFFSMAMRSAFIDSPLLACVKTGERLLLQKELEQNTCSLDELNVRVGDLQVSLISNLEVALFSP